LAAAGFDLPNLEIIVVKIQIASSKGMPHVMLPAVPDTALSFVGYVSYY
jgi:hypothetical protein